MEDQGESKVKEKDPAPKEENGIKNKTELPPYKRNSPIESTYESTETTDTEKTEDEDESGNTAEREEELREEAIQAGIHGRVESIKLNNEE